MSLRIHRVQVWSGEIPDKPGAAAAMPVEAIDAMIARNVMGNT